MIILSDLTRKRRTAAMARHVAARDAYPHPWKFRHQCACSCGCPNTSEYPGGLVRCLNCASADHSGAVAPR